MQSRLIMLFVRLLFLLAAAVSPVGNSANAAFEKLLALEGQWSGSYEWSGARTDRGSMDATYSITGNGSAVVENLTVDGKPLMTTVYHLDGDALRMTHYCAARNQPRLRARTIDLSRGVVEFDFVDATNLRSADAPHVHGFEIHFVNDDHIQLVFLFHAGEQRSRETVDLKRVQRSV